jgi:hypothetical protein
MASTVSDPVPKGKWLKVNRKQALRNLWTAETRNILRLPPTKHSSKAIISTRDASIATGVITFSTGPGATPAGNATGPRGGHIHARPRLWAH